jgi:hypothetical protein
MDSSRVMLICDLVEIRTNERDAAAELERVRLEWRKGDDLGNETAALSVR